MRVCPLCKRSPRESDPLQAVRLAHGDMADRKPGLYHGCEECIATIRPNIVKRVNAEHGTKFTVETLPGSFLS